MKKLLACSVHQDEFHGGDQDNKTYLLSDPDLRLISKQFKKENGLYCLVIQGGSFLDKQTVVRQLTDSIHSSSTAHQFILNESGILTPDNKSEFNWHSGSYLSNGAWLFFSSAIIGLVLLSYEYESKKSNSLVYFNKNETCPDSTDNNYNHHCLEGPHSKSLTSFEQFGRVQNGNTLFDQPFYPLFLMFLFQGFIGGAQFGKHLLFSMSKGKSFIKKNVTWSTKPLTLDALRGSKYPLNLGFIRSIQNSIGVITQLSAIEPHIHGEKGVDGFLDTLVAGNSTFNWADSSRVPIENSKALLLFFSSNKEVANMMISGKYDRRFSSGRYHSYTIKSLFEPTEKNKAYIRARMSLHLSKTKSLDTKTLQDKLIKSCGTETVFWKNSKKFEKLDMGKHYCEKQYIVWNAHLDYILSRTVRSFSRFLDQKTSDFSEYRDVCNSLFSTMKPVYEELGARNKDLLETQLQVAEDDNFKESLFVTAFIKLISDTTSIDIVRDWKSSFLLENSVLEPRESTYFKLIFDDRLPTFSSIGSRNHEFTRSILMHNDNLSIESINLLLDIDPFALLIEREEFISKAIQSVDDYIDQLKTWIKDPFTTTIKNPIFILSDKKRGSLPVNLAMPTYGIAKSTSAKAMFIYLQKRIKEEKLDYGIKLLRDKNHVTPHFYTNELKREWGVEAPLNRAIEIGSFVALESFMLYTKLAADSYRNFLYQDMYPNHITQGEPGFVPFFPDGQFDMLKSSESPFDNDPDYGWYRGFKEVNFGWVLYGITFFMGVANLILSAYLDQTNRKEEPSTLLPLGLKREMVTVYENDEISDLEGGYNDDSQPQDRVFSSGKESKLIQAHGGMLFIENLDDTKSSVLETLTSIAHLGQFNLGGETNIPYTGIIVGCTNHLEKVPNYFHDNADIVIELDALVRTKKDKFPYLKNQVRCCLIQYQHDHDLKPLSLPAEDLFINTVFSETRDKHFFTRIFLKNWLESADLFEDSDTISLESLKQGWGYMKRSSFNSVETRERRVMEMHEYKKVDHQSFDWIDTYLKEVHKDDKNYKWKDALSLTSS